MARWKARLMSIPSLDFRLIVRDGRPANYYARVGPDTTDIDGGLDDDTSPINPVQTDFSIICVVTHDYFFANSRSFSFVGSNARWGISTIQGVDRIVDLIIDGKNGEKTLPGVIRGTYTCTVDVRDDDLAEIGVGVWNYKLILKGQTSDPDLTNGRKTLEEEQEITVLETDDVPIVNDVDKVCLLGSNGQPYSYTSREEADSKWAGRLIIFNTGPNAGYGETVAKTMWNEATKKVQGVVLSNRLKEKPVNGNIVHVVYQDTTNQENVYEQIDGQRGVTTKSYQTITDFDNEIDNISFETEVDKGYSKATIELNSYSSKLGNLYSEAIGKILEIYDPYGMVVYYGLVYSVSLTGRGATLNAMSLMDTFSWYYLREFSWPADTKITQVLRDIVSTNVLLNYYYGYSSIDPGVGATLSTIVTTAPGGCTTPWYNYLTCRTWASYADAKLGAKEYTQEDRTAKEILDEVLAMGFYGTPEATEGYKVALQVWANGIPRLAIIPRAPARSDVKYLITPRNFNLGLDGLSIESDLSEAESIVYTTYNDEEGEQLRAASAINYELYKRFGPKGVVYRSSGDSEAELLNAMFALSKDKSQITSPGSMTLVGNLRGGYGHPYVPVWRIKAGDIVAFDFSPSNATNMYRNAVSSPGIFIVGSTSYSTSANSVTITNYTPAKWREIFNAGIEM